MATDILEREHDVRKLFMGDLNAFTEVAYRIILAEYAAEIAVAEKNRP